MERRFNFEFIYFLQCYNFKWNANGLYRKSTYRCFNQSLYFPVQRRLYCAHLGERRYILWQSWEFESRIWLDQLDQSVQHCYNDINNPEHLSGRFCANLWTVGQPARYVFRYPSNCHRLWLCSGTKCTVYPCNREYITILEHMPGRQCSNLRNVGFDGNDDVWFFVDSSRLWFSRRTRSSSKCHCKYYYRCCRTLCWG